MIARNALLNLAGHAAPLGAALVLVPPLVSHLGGERFGFLALAWALVGYFSLFDLGLGRALSRLIAERRGTPGEAGLPRLSRTALSLTAALGAAAGVILFAAAGAVSTRLLELPAALQAEGKTALQVLAVALPMVTLTAALRGILEAAQRFGWVNAIRIPLGVLTFGAPLAATLSGPSLVSLAVALASVRLAALIAHWLACARLYPDLVSLGPVHQRAAREMLGYGAWLTVSNVVGPLMVYVDRFAIAGMLAISWVAYYSAPYEVVTRLWLVPAALTGVLFPAMAAASPERLAALYRTGVKAVSLAVFPIALVAILFAPEWLEAWLGGEFAARGAAVARLLAFGAAVNSLAYLPFTVLQARGRADLTAKCHLAELPPYLALLWLAVRGWGIEGAALVWALRCLADAAALFFLARHAQPRFNRAQLAVMGLALAALGAAMAPFSLAQKLIYLLAALALLGALGWRFLLDESERARARHPLALISGELR